MKVLRTLTNTIFITLVILYIITGVFVIFIINYLNIWNHLKRGGRG